MHVWQITVHVPHACMLLDCLLARLLTYLPTYLLICSDGSNEWWPAGPGQSTWQFRLRGRERLPRLGRLQQTLNSSTTRPMDLLLAGCQTAQRSTTGHYSAAPARPRVASVVGTRERGRRSLSTLLRQTPPACPLARPHARVPTHTYTHATCIRFSAFGGFFPS